MTPKQKAEKLIDVYAYLVGYSCVNTDIRFEADFSKQCALIACNLLIKHSKDIAEVYDLTFDESTSYFHKVKDEIKKYQFPFEKQKI